MRAIACGLVAVVAVVVAAEGAASARGPLPSAPRASPAPAASGSLQLAIVPFTGLHADEPQSVVVRMLKKRAQLVEAAAVGTTNADVLISGTIEHPEGKLQLVVSALSVKSGDVVGQLTFAIPKTRHLDREQLKQLAMQVNDLANQAIIKVTGESASGPPPAEDEANAAVEEAVAQSTDSERVPLDIADLGQAQLRGRPRLRVFGPRPPWAPLLDAAVGIVISGRSLSINPAPAATYKPGSGAGIHVDVTLYPLAGLYDKGKGVLAGLGAGLTLDSPQTSRERGPSNSMK